MTFLYIVNIILVFSECIVRNEKKKYVLNFEILLDLS